MIQTSHTSRNNCGLGEAEHDNACDDTDVLHGEVFRHLIPLGMNLGRELFESGVV